ncbi:methyltransferase domain-containing protein [Arthrobacter psychrochitiniphilus]|uniref:methyltransferase domain-containing protein n=1 Tax=Arthrobacter psychrochitiniphilus TaxID=291045 RepID=UPI003F7C2E1D
MGDGTFLWEPDVYGHFSDFRSRPFFDLTFRIGATAPRSVVDLGCGPGTLSATLAQRWPGASVLGLDSSAAMIAQARTLLPSPASTLTPDPAHDGGPSLPPATHRRPAQLEPGLAFVQGDITAWRPGSGGFAGPAIAAGAPPVDVVVSNAALQWVPEHRDLMAQWLAELRPGAWLAVQVPGNFGSPSHVLLRELAGSPRWRKQLDGVLGHHDAVAEPSEYQELLLSNGATADVWETTYNHLLPGESPVLGWVRGTALRPVAAALGAEEMIKFEQMFEPLLVAAYPPGKCGTIFPFRRIFMVGEKQ